MGSTGAGDPVNGYYQILQSSGQVVLLMETFHDARIISLDGRPHLSDRIRQWHGDSRGRWDSDTLVIDTTNFSPKSDFLGSGANLHLVERLTRTAPDAIDYEVTLEDPTTWNAPWTALIRLTRMQSKIYRYACHEGNRAMDGILASCSCRGESDRGSREGSEVSKSLVRRGIALSSLNPNGPVEGHREHAKVWGAGLAFSPAYHARHGERLMEWTVVNLPFPTSNWNTSVHSPRLI